MILGWKKDGVPEGLYCGLDGVKAGQIAAKAQASGEYIRMGRLTNPSYTPLPCFPTAKAKAPPLKVPPPSKPTTVAPQAPAPVAQPQAAEQADSATGTTNESESNE